MTGYIDFFEKMMSNEEKEFAMMVTYREVIYRYIGLSSSCNKECVEIEYNDIYVSWSKKEQNDYIESKLYGPLLWIKAKTLPYDYAIDLERIDKFYQKIHWREQKCCKGERKRSGLSDKKGMYIRDGEKVIGKIEILSVTCLVLLMNAV